jgi:hypothetical protein
VSEQESCGVRRAYQADYISWLKKQTWDPVEAAILLAGFEPEAFEEGDSSMKELQSKVDGVHRLIMMDIVAKKLDARNTPEQWLGWAQTANVQFPDELASAAKASQLDSDEPKILKRAALISHFRSRWPDIGACLSEASRNGLQKAMVRDQRGYWYVLVVGKWGIENGKLSKGLGFDLRSRWSGSTTTHKVT